VIALLPAIATALQSSGYRLTSYATVQSAGVPLGTFVVEDGTVTIDRTASVRRTIAVTLRPDAVPTSMASTVAPNGNEMLLFTTITALDGSGTTQTFPHGVFPITTVTVTDTGVDLTLTLQGSDRAWQVARHLFLGPYVPTAGTLLGDALTALISSVYPGLSYAITPTTAMIPAASFNEGDDPWASALSIAAATGFELFFDVVGQVTAQPIPDPTAQPIAFAFVEGPYTPMLGAAHVLTSDGIQNDFIVSSSSSQVTPVRGEASDTNPSSPTFTGGTFGDIPNFSTSDLVSDVPSATAAAANLLAASLGAAETFTLTTRTMPMLDVDDVVTITRARLGMNATPFVIDHAQHSLRYDGTSTLTLRRAV
jgi:hypothetical protein